MVKLKNISTLFLLIITINYAYSMPNVSRALSEVEFITENSENTKLDIYKGKIMASFFSASSELMLELK